MGLKWNFTKQDGDIEERRSLLGGSSSGRGDSRKGGSNKNKAKQGILDGTSAKYGTVGAEETVENDALYMGVDKRALMNTGTEGLTSEEAAFRLERFGRNELAEKEQNIWLNLLKEFVKPMALIVWGAVMIEFIEALAEGPEYWADVVVLVILQMVNALVGWYEEMKAGNAVAALKNSLKPEALVMRDGEAVSLSAALLVPGDRIILSAGSSIPADCMLGSGKPIQVDQAALTGESLPVTMHTGDMAKMGSTVTRGEIDALVSATGAQTYFGRTASLINKVEDGGNFEKVLLKITLTLTGGGACLDLITLVYLLVRGESFLDALAFAVVLLVASIPIAMRVVCSTMMALGSRQLAEDKAIVTRLSAIEDLAGMTVLCADKTGTLTLNKMELQDELPLFCEGVTRHDVLVAAALATKWREPAKDALDTLVLSAIDLSPLDMYLQVDYVPFDPRVKRTESTLQRADGSTFKVTKGAPQVILDMAYNKADIAEQVEAQVTALAKRGVRCLAVACSNELVSGWVFMGILTFLDPPRPDSARTIAKAREFGVGVKMITGDQAAIATEMCRTIGLGSNILGTERLPKYNPNEKVSPNLGRDYGSYVESADGFAQVFPEHKFMIVEALRQRGFVVGMTGDGVNDSPALKRADVGIAVQGATDAARAAADMVLTAPGLSTIVRAILISRQIFQRMKNYIIYRISCTIQLLIFFFISCLFLDPSSLQTEWSLEHDGLWPTFFRIPVMGLVLITILNDGTIISIAYDKVPASAVPEKWDLMALGYIAGVIGGVAVVSSIILLYTMADSGNPASSFASLGFQPLTYGEIQTMMYLKISLSDFFSIFSARTMGFFWTRKPSPLLSGAFTLATTTSSIMSLYWPFGEMEPLNLSLVTFVWVYTVLWFLVQDACKVALYNVMFKTGRLVSLGHISEEDLISEPISQFERTRQHHEKTMRSSRGTLPSVHDISPAQSKPRGYGGVDGEELHHVRFESGQRYMINQENLWDQQDV